MAKLKKGDKVKVMLGKDRGKEGVVEKIFHKKGRVWIGGVNIYKRHIRKNVAANNEGGVIDVIKPLDISNVSLLCPNCSKVTRVGFEIIKNEKVRICRKCKKQI